MTEPTTPAASPQPRPLLDLTSTTGIYEWAGGAIGLLHELLHTEQGRTFLQQHYYERQTELLYDSYRAWLSATLAKYDLGRGAA